MMTDIAETLLIKVDSQNPAPELMALAGTIICQGGLVAFPTETVYGLGANTLDHEAVSKIFAAKQRPANDPVIVHIDTIEQLSRVAVEIPELAYTLAEKFWAGALTLVLKKHPDIPTNVTAGGDTVAVRMPNHPVALALIRKAGVPIAAPSANRFSRPSPTTAAHVLADLAGEVDVILDSGATPIGVESTIVDLTVPVPMILRPGGVSLEALREVMPALAFRPRYLSEEVESVPAPGTLLKHYSPDAEVCLFRGDTQEVYDRMRQTAQEAVEQNRRVGLLLMDDETGYFEGFPAAIGLLGNDLTAMANTLFAGLRELDTQGVDVILVRAPQQTGLGLAIGDRLLRAAIGQVIEVC